MNCIHGVILVLVKNLIFVKRVKQYNVLRAENDLKYAQEQNL